VIPVPKKLLIAGYVNIDLVVSLGKILEPGERITVTKIDETPGGMAANCACAAAKLGAEVVFFGSVGEDNYGRILLDDFSSNGVCTDWIKIDKSVLTTRCFILVFPDGDRSIISEKMHFDYAPIRNFIASREINETAILHFDGYRIEDCQFIITGAHEKGVMVSIDLDGIDENVNITDELLGNIDIVFINKNLVTDILKVTDIHEAVSMIYELGPRIVIATQGANGALLCTEGNYERVKGHELTVHDTIGAGDVFDGAFLSYYVKTNDPFISLKYANAAAALSVTGRGARGHLPGEREVLDLLRAG
jgi:sugar/nucleoside kinase (ribokinase family)